MSWAGERAAQTVFRMIATGRGSTEDHMGAVHLAVRESCDGPVAELAERRA